MNVALWSLTKVESIRLLTVNIPLGREDALPTEILERESDSAYPGEEVYEFKALSTEVQPRVIELRVQTGKLRIPLVD